MSFLFKYPFIQFYSKIKSSNTIIEMLNDMNIKNNDVWMAQEIPLFSMLQQYFDRSALFSILLSLDLFRLFSKV